MSCFQGRVGEGFDGGEAAGSELFGWKQGRGICADVLQRLAHFLELEDAFQELEFVDERALGETPTDYFTEQM